MATDIEISAYSIWADLQKIRSTNPLVHNITNSVVQDFTANALLALGASPIMSDSVDETEELVAASQRAQHQHRHTESPIDGSDGERRSGRLENSGDRLRLTRSRSAPPSCAGP